MSKEKQIEEMAEVIRHSCEGECFRNKDGFTDCEACEACLLYEAGYRKQSEGEWHWIADDSPMCNICGNVFDTNDDADAGLWKFCPNCGAKMKN